MASSYPIGIFLSRDTWNPCRGAWYSWNRFLQKDRGKKIRDPARSVLAMKVRFRYSPSPVPPPVEMRALPLQNVHLSKEVKKGFPGRPCYSIVRVPVIRSISGRSLENSKSCRVLRDRRTCLDCRSHPDSPNFLGFGIARASRIQVREVVFFFADRSTNRSDEVNPGWKSRRNT